MARPTATSLKAGQLRAEISIDGILRQPRSSSTLRMALVTRLELPAGTSGAYNVKIEYFARKIMMRTGHLVPVVPNLYHRGGRQRCRHAMGE